MLEEAIAEAADAAPVVAAHASLVQLLVRLRAGKTEHWQEEAAVTIAEAMAVFERVGDHAGLAKGWRLLAWSHGAACRFELTAEAHERALEQAALAGDVRQQRRSATAYGAAAVFGPTPAREGIERCEAMVEKVSGDRHSEGILLALVSSLHAMEGSFDLARELSARGRSMLDDLGLALEGAFVDIERWRVEMLAGDVVAAERELRRAYDALVAVGERFVLSTVAGNLAQTLYALERFDEVEELGDLSRELATDDDVDTQALWRCVRAKVLALRGSFDSAEAHVARGARDPRADRCRAARVRRSARPRGGVPARRAGRRGPRRARGRAAHRAAEGQSRDGGRSPRPPRRRGRSLGRVSARPTPARASAGRAQSF